MYNKIKKKKKQSHYDMLICFVYGYKVHKIVYEINNIVNKPCED